jgi:hypothetical protein
MSSEITEADRQAAEPIATDIARPFIPAPEVVERIAQALADQRASLTADITERIRAVREHAWGEGYEASYRGEQRHNPYRSPRPEVTP